MAYFLANGGEVLPIANGGTGASTAANALKNLGITATAIELNYCSNVTSNIQTQLNNLLAKTSWTKVTSNAVGTTGVTISSSIDWNTIRVGAYVIYSNDYYWYYCSLITKAMFPDNNSETRSIVIGGYDTKGGSNKDVGFCGLYLGRTSSSGGDYTISLRREILGGLDYSSNVRMDIEYK